MSDIAGLVKFNSLCVSVSLRLRVKFLCYFDRQAFFGKTPIQNFRAVLSVLAGKRIIQRIFHIGAATFGAEEGDTTPAARAADFGGFRAIGQGDAD